MARESQKGISLRTKLMIITLLLFAVPNIIVGTVGYMLSKEELDKSGKIQLQNDVRFVIGMIDLLDSQVKKGSLKLSDAQEMVKREILGEKRGDGKRSITKRYNLGEHGYFVVYDLNGNEVAHPSLEGKNVLDLVSPDGVHVAKDTIQTAKEGGGYLTYIWPLPNSKENAPKIAYAELDPHWNWVVSAGSYMQDYNSGSMHILYLLMLVLGVFFLLGGLVALLFANYISKPIMKIANEAKRVAGGDLTVEKIVVRNKDEIGHLAEFFNQMIDNLHLLLRHVRNSVDHLSGSANHFSLIAEESQNVTGQIYEASQEVAAGAEKQAASTTSSERRMNEISNGMDQVSYAIQTVASSSIEANSKAVSGNEIAIKAVSQMSVVQATVDESASIVYALGERSKKITQIVSLITEIANQTNLLSLNAAIEAARAGEHGKGFAVVAGEVRKLAEQSRSAAAEIDSLIKGIQGEAEKAVHSMLEGSVVVKEGIEMVHQTTDSFREIVGVVENVSVQSQEVAAIIEQVKESTQEMVEAIKQVSQFSLLSASSTHQIAASIHEQNRTMTEISTSSENFNNHAKELQDVIGRFKIEIDNK